MRADGRVVGSTTRKARGSEEFQKYMEDLTDMQNHVLPYLQSFCSSGRKRRAGETRTADSGEK